ncbi:exodeoxyribonuclease VII large subunit [Caenimonas koreensis DSM 17982]|uniref:Exodeoxyribonuclease VII large subunit n=1 Tax=Caenimonas koreensis DSM 17982 TaxID=1121255 RepID=A0A844BGX0_9BURK|nr:exodeoxyribonuclease VII large subunit [Caenimonas koreensis]MRD49691.1 exodeoxyribonuclease VII large subunit [Caenimonas koreensis DSM 17982]
MSRTYLTAPYSERTGVKELGARWDSDERKWFVPDGLALEPFARWLPAAVGRPEPSSNSRALAAASAPQAESLPSTQKGIRLAALMQRVSAAVHSAFSEGVWTRLEVIDVSARGHVYLEVADRDESGRVLAKTRAMIWGAVAQKLLPRFLSDTGMELAPGIKLLVRAKPSMHAEYGFGLVIEEIDPEYTLGDLEARKREIRARLQSEGLWDRNRQLPAPWDFTEVLVIAPEQAAGLGDFQAEAARLQLAGVCRFTYAHSRFQGAGAANEICAAASEGLGSLAARGIVPDAIVIIRGGGAVNDLAWLNEYCLCRFVCEAPAPVFTGIGHQRDSTLVDEVAHTAFDTPSKVIVGIEAGIATRARDARAAFEEICALARIHVQRSRGVIRQHVADVRHGALQLHAAAARGTDSLLAEVRELSRQHIHRATTHSRERIGVVNVESQGVLAKARAEAPLRMHEVAASARAHITAARHGAQTARGALLEVSARAVDGQRSAARHALQETTHAARALLTRATHDADWTHASVLQRCAEAVARSRDAQQRSLQEIAQESMRAVHRAREASAGLMREIIGQGPEKTLRRGFAVVRNSQGDPVTSAEQAASCADIGLQFQDGVVHATLKKDDRQ